MFDDADDIGLGEAVYRIVDVLRDSPAAGGAVTDHWTRMVSTIAKHDSLPFSDVKVVEQVIAVALPEALLDEVMQVAWYEATLLKKQQAKARRRRKK